jgi:mono/diheme cytochrome c family protein
VADSAGPVPALVATVMKRGKKTEVEGLMGWIADESRPAAQRVALLRGLRGGGSGGPGGPGRGRGAALQLEEKPDALLRAAASSDPRVRSLASALAAAAVWPGKPGADTLALSPMARRSYQAGRQTFNSICAACHQQTGMGMQGVAKRLVGSPWVLGSPAALIRIVLEGKEGEMLMPPIGASLTDEQVASVLTYVRNQWGNHASPVSVEQVAAIRAQTADRKKPWTEEELAAFAK